MISRLVLRQRLEVLPEGGHCLKLLDALLGSRELPEDVGMEEAAPHPARANPLESLAVPVPVRYDVAHLGVYCVCLVPDGERDASTRWTRLVHQELPEQEPPRLRPPCVDSISEDLLSSSLLGLT